MAATFSSPSTVVRLGSATSFSSPPNNTCLSSVSECMISEFLKSSVRGRNPLRLAGACGGKFTCFERDWLRRDFNVIGFGLIGWIAPSSIPAINGKSLTGLLFESIGTELAHFPTPPPPTSQFCYRFFNAICTLGS
ncbi:hypothetical protein Godav_025331 [Gossypium davidsonii]|uniref:Photosystem I subunit O n=2 Tax=Gossypium TaxID=3633 RepID=A0A7J8TGY7_GOSDV|nr:hypothetical protein [Gossypium davidsonii]MBA0639781.1 hypothetical protein [Gossypium klotzschianum]